MQLETANFAPGAAAKPSQQNTIPVVFDSGLFPPLYQKSMTSSTKVEVYCHLKEPSRDHRQHVQKIWTCGFYRMMLS